MTEEEARLWVRKRFGVSRETQLEQFGQLLLNEAERQNLIARSTFDELWNRHLLDSAQLVVLAEQAQARLVGLWLDVGSGAGLPGMVAALLQDREVVLVEPRSRRVEFLNRAAQALGIEARVRVIASKIESYRCKQTAAIVSARAVASLPALFGGASHCTDRETIWVLPKGRNAQSEVEAARRSWQGSFHVEQSVTSTDSLIVIAREVKPR